MVINALLPLRETLLDRRQKLDAAAAVRGAAPNLDRLIAEVDAALARIESGSYGLCETCHDPIETDRLLADPLLRFCLDHLTPREQRALEQDLELAARIQRELLPPVPFRVGRWKAAYTYEPAGQVSGDYCDLISAGNGDVHFIVGDVSGKGVAAVMVISDGRPAGIVSAKDFGRRVVLEGRSLEGTRVGDIMTSPVITVSPTTTVSEAMAVMTRNRIRHLPVMDEDKLVGIVAMGDLARAVIAEQAFMIDQLHGYVGHGYPV